MSNLNEITKKMIDESQGGIMAIDIFDRRTGISIAGHQTHAKACALYNNLLDTLTTTLAKADGLMKPHETIIITEKNDTGLVVLVELTEQHRLGMKVDTTKCSLGLLLAVVLQDGIAQIQAALPPPRPAL